MHGGRGDGRGQRGGRNGGHRRGPKRGQGRGNHRQRDKPRKSQPDARLDRRRVKKQLAAHKLLKKPPESPRRSSVVHEIDESFEGLCMEDYERMERVPLAINEQLHPLIRTAACVGHALRGHCAFEGVRYPNTTVEDVWTALGWQWDSMWESVQQWTDDGMRYANMFLDDPNDPRLQRLYSLDGARPLFGTPFTQTLRDPSESASLVRGLILTSLMDTMDPWRNKVLEDYDFDTGGGDRFPVDLDKLRENGLTLDVLSRLEHTDRDISRLFRKGILKRDGAPTSNTVRGGYVRRRKGRGVSDDMALLNAGMFYGGVPALIGAVGGDFYDTICKSARIISTDFDEKLGTYLWTESQERGIDLGITEEDIAGFIAISAADPENASLRLHCSQRYFYQLEEDGFFALGLHKDFVEEGYRSSGSRLRRIARQMPVMDMSYARQSSRQFYMSYVDRIKLLEKDRLTSSF